MAMADGYAQASGNLAVLNLHVAPGLGNAMGMLYDAQKANAPVLVTAGQQDLEYIVTEPVLTADLPTLARPFVKWAAEVQRARGPAALRASRGEDRAGAADRPGVPVAAGRHSQKRRRHRPARADPRRAAGARRCRCDRRGRRDAGQGRAAGHHRRRRRGAEPRAQGTGRACRSHRRAGLCRVHAEHGVVSGVASALSRHDDALPGRRTRGAGPSTTCCSRSAAICSPGRCRRPSIRGRKVCRSFIWTPIRGRSARTIRHKVGDPRRSESNAAGYHRGGRCAHDRGRQERRERRGSHPPPTPSKKIARRFAPRRARWPARRRCSRWRSSKRSARCCRMTPW